MEHFDAIKKYLLFASFRFVWFSCLRFMSKTITIRFNIKHSVVIWMVSMVRRISIACGVALGVGCCQTTHTRAHKIYIFSTEEWSRRDKKLWGEISNIFFRYISSTKYIKLFFIIKVNTFRGEISMHEISGAKRMMEISMQIYIKILYTDDVVAGAGEGIRYTTTSERASERKKIQFT